MPRCARRLTRWWRRSLPATLRRRPPPRLRTLCQRAGLPVQAPPLSQLPISRWMDLMRVDKKAEGGEIRFVVIDGPGRAAMLPAPDALVAEVITAHAAPG